VRHKALAVPDDEWNLAVMRFADTVRGDLAYLRPRVLRCGRLVPHVDGLNGPDLAVIVDAAPRSNALEAAREIALAAARAIFSGLCGVRVVVASGAEDRAACRLAGAMQRGPMSKQEIAVVEPVDDLPALLPEELARARQYAAASKAASTRDKYERGWSDFRAWCHARGHEALPADPVVVAAYLLSFEADRGMSPSAIQVKLAAIAWVHKRAGHQPPQRTEQGVSISDVMGGIRREHGTLPVRKAAADGDIVRDVLQAITGDGLREARDRALLAFGMASAMRRSELVALEVEDIARDQRGLRVTIRRSKTDQDGKGAAIAVPEGRRLRPVARLREWTERAGTPRGRCSGASPTTADGSLASR
jgi:integrase